MGLTISGNELYPSDKNVEDTYYYKVKIVVAAPEGNVNYTYKKENSYTIVCGSLSIVAPSGVPQA